MEHDTKQREHKYLESYCAEPTCEFFNERTQQGVCHTRETDVFDTTKLDKLTDSLENDLREMKEREGENYEAALESYYICAHLNWSSVLDQVISLRIENRRLRKQLGLSDERV